LVIIAAPVKYGFDLERERRHAGFLAKHNNYAELLARFPVGTLQLAAYQYVISSEK